jgi:predicted CxxxxCH...CXXCH cytochrome family protein
MSDRRIAIVLVAVLVAAGVILGAGCSFESPPDSIPPPNADPQAGCAIDCHGDDTSNAPPKSMSGATETSSVAVGAHREHMNVAPTWHRQIQCGDCHVVPGEVGAPGHIDGDGTAEVTFAMIAGDGAKWDGTTCVTACHGSGAVGGAQPKPTWTVVDGSQATCGSCHGRPPPAPHPTDTRCALCHPTMEVNGTFRDPASHINGVVDKTAPGAMTCMSCHGSDDGGSAPPKDLSGDLDRTAPGVGAHAAHLQLSTWHRPVQCSSCHTVPGSIDAPGHRDGDGKAEIKFDTLNPGAAYASANTTCSTLYCHGNGRGSNGTASWVAAGPLVCTSCHHTDGETMSGKHKEHIKDRGIKCSSCHGSVIDANQKIINANLHINGLHEIKLPDGNYNATTKTCTKIGGCHNNPRSWLGD